MKSKNKYLITTAGIITGATIGFFYWKFIGCENGCSIKSVWWRMTLWGGVIGGLLTNMLLDFYIKLKAKKASNK